MRIVCFDLFLHLFCALFLSFLLFVQPHKLIFVVCFGIFFFSFCLSFRLVSNKRKHFTTQDKNRTKQNRENFDLAMSNCVCESIYTYTMASAIAIITWQWNLNAFVYLISMARNRIQFSFVWLSSASASCLIYSIFSLLSFLLLLPSNSLQFFTCLLFGCFDFAHDDLTDHQQRQRRKPLWGAFNQRS